MPDDTRRVSIDYYLQVKQLRSALSNLKGVADRTKALTDRVKELANEYEVAEGAVWELIKAQNEYTRRTTGKGIFSPEIEQNVQTGLGLGKTAPRPTDNIGAMASGIASSVGPVLSGMDDAGLRLVEYEKAIRELAQTAAISWEEAAAALKKTTLGAEQGSAEISNALGQMKNSIRPVTEEAARLQTALQNVGERFNLSQATGDVGVVREAISMLATDANMSFTEAGRQIERTFNVSRGVVNGAVRQMENRVMGLRGIFKATFGDISKIIQTAFGTFMAMVLFKATQAISQFFTDATQLAEDYRKSMAKLGLVEEYLSGFGVDITPDDLKDIIKNLDELFVTVSESKITKLVADLGDLTKQFGVTKEQLNQLGQAVLAFQIKNPEKELADIQSAIISAVAKGRYDALEGYGIQISETIIKSKALDMQLIKTNEELDGQARFTATLAAIMGQLEPQMQDIIDAQNDIAYASAKARAEYEDAAEEIGSAFLPITGLLETGSLQVFAKIADLIKATINAIKFLLGVYTAAWGSIVSATIMAISNIKSILAGDGVLFGFRELIFAIQETYIEAIKTLFDEIENTDTLTGQGQLFPDMDEDSDEVDKLAKRLRDLAEEMDNFGDKARKMAEDFRVANERALYDYNLEVARTTEDYQYDRLKIIQDANDKIQEEQEEYRRNEVNEEAKFLEKLRQLREKFLFDLEDALRERDARQVLRLQKQYQMDKQALINENALNKEERQRQYKDEIADIIEQRDRKLAELDYEHQLTLKRMQDDFNEKQKRRREDYDAEIKELQDQVEDRLRVIANNLAEELDLNVASADEIYKALSRVYGPGGGIDTMVKWTYDSMVQRAYGMYQLLSQYVGLYAQLGGMLTATLGAIPSLSGITLPTFGGGGGGYPNRIYPMAKGGTIIARKPTLAMFGEAGAEAASFIPLNQLGSQFGGTAMDKSGNLKIAVYLSPDLEARIVENSLNEVGGIIQEIGRMR